MDRIVTRSAFLILLAMTPPAAHTQEPAFFAGRQALWFEQSPGIYHFVRPCDTGPEFAGPAEIRSKLVGSSESALCWPLSVIRVSKNGAKFDASPVVNGRLVISPGHVRFLPNEGKDAGYYADFAPTEVKFEHKTGQANAFFGASMDQFYKFNFVPICLTCRPGTPVPATTNVAQLDQEFEQVRESIGSFERTRKKIEELTAKFRIEVRPENQPTRTDAAEAAHLFAELNTRFADFCGEPARSCFRAFAAYEGCKAPSWDAECGARPACSASCFATAQDLVRLNAGACVLMDEAAASLIPDWSEVIRKKGGSYQPQRNPKAGRVEVEMRPGVNPPSGVGCGVNATLVRASLPPEAFGVAGMEGLGGFLGAAGRSSPDSMAPGVGRVQGNRVDISAGVAAGNILLKVPPVYPPVAKAARIQGTVVLSATIAKTGEIINLSVVSGPALLQGAAIDAVKQWRYKPYLLEGEPVEVLTTVNVIFTLGGEPAASGALPERPQ